MLKTFGDIKRSRVIQIASASPDGKEFKSLVNSATRQIMNRGNFWGTVQPIQGCVYGGCVTWPASVATILAMDVCHHHTQPANRWYSFMPWDGTCSSWAMNYRNSHRHNLGLGVTVSDGTMPVFNPIPCGEDRFVQFSIDNRMDSGKTIRIYGVDGGGQVLCGKRPDGTFQEGILLTLNVVPVASPIKIRRIDRVVKDVTVGRVRGYQIDITGALWDMAVYEPWETSPDYVRTRLPHTRCCTSVTALVKLAFIPVTYDDDLVLIDNVDALRDMVMSIKAKESGNIVESRAMEQSAFRELNYELRNRMPDEQFVLTFRPFGNDSLQSQGVGMI
jgi:hypothetical protein